MIEITWTDAGKWHAFTNSIDLETVEAMLRGDIERGDVHPARLVFHVVEVGEIPFFVTPCGDGLLIDGCTFERCEIESGEFAGRVACIPSPMSEDDE